MSFPKYEKYKVTDVDWLGSLPDRWEVKRLKASATCNDEVLPEGTDPDTVIEYVEISGVDEGRGIVYTETLAFSAAPSRARRVVRHGDVLISTVRTYLRAIATVSKPPSNLIASTGFVVVRPRAVHAGFLGYMLHCEYLVSEVIARSVGISYPAINASDLMRLKGPVPSAEEQAAIATFLDRETAKIDGPVEEQQRLIELLKEKRQAVISHAVTKGLNPNAPMKDSGVEWLGKVPAHWEVTALKRFCETITDGAHVSPDTENGVVSFVSTKDVGNDSIDFDGCLKTSEESYSLMVRSGCQPLLGDVLFSKDGTIGRTVIVRENRTFAVASSLIIIRPERSLLDAEFLNYLCQSSPVAGQVEGFVKGAGLPRLSIQNLLKVIGVFPTLDEQTEVARFLSVETRKAGALIAEAHCAAAILQERRTALISAAVTGKIDVRAKMRQPEPAPA